MRPTPRRILAAALVLAAGTSQAANLVTNGSFEDPNKVGGGYWTYLPGSTAITGWTVVGPTISGETQLTPDTYMGLKASDGRQWIDLTGIYGYDKGLVSDSFATVAGATYHVSFDVGNYVPFGRATLGVSLNGGTEQRFTNMSLATTATSPMNWASFGFDWVADGPSARITFLGRANGTNSNNGGIGLDHVVVELKSVAPPVTAVPEPSTYALMGAGLALVGAIARRRRRA